MKNFNFGAFLILTMASGITDLAGHLYAIVHHKQMFSPVVRKWMDAVAATPWTSFVLGVCFGIASVVATQRLKKVTPTDIFGLGLLCGLTSLVLNMITIFVAPLLGVVFIPPAAFVGGGFVFFFGLFLREMLAVEIGPVFLLFAWVFGGIISVCPGIPGVPVTTGMVWHTLAGAYYAFVIARVS